MALCVCCDETAQAWGECDGAEARPGPPSDRACPAPFAGDLLSLLSLFEGRDPAEVVRAISNAARG
jgi:hypothetical protein